MACSASFRCAAPPTPVMSGVKPLTEESERFETFLKDFRKSGPHGVYKWPRGITHLILHFPENDYLQDLYTCNTDFSHAEMNAIRYLENRCVKKVVMYLNWSPCSDCSHELKAFVKTKRSDPDFLLEIVFRGVYFIRRDSCTNECGCINTPGNSDGLYNLSLLKPACTVRSFNGQDWEDLKRLLHDNTPKPNSLSLSDPDQTVHPRRKDECDKEIADDFEMILLYETFEQNIV